MDGVDGVNDLEEKMNSPLYTVQSIKASIREKNWAHLHFSFSSFMYLLSFFFTPFYFCSFFAREHNKKEKE